MLAATGSTTLMLTEEGVWAALAGTFDAQPLEGTCVLAIIPDGTRTMPIPLLFRLLNETLGARVTLATGIPEERCRRINLGYRDWRATHPEDWANREDEGYLLVPHAGEMLFQVRA